MRRRLNERFELCVRAFSLLGAPVLIHATPSPESRIFAAFGAIIQFAGEVLNTQSLDYAPMI